jgi:hypothetical protein
MNAPLNIALCPHCVCNKPCAATLVVEKSRCTSYVNRRERSAFSGTCVDIMSTMIASNPFFSCSKINLHFSCDAAVKMPICNQVHNAPTLFASQSPSYPVVRTQSRNCRVKQDKNGDLSCLVLFERTFCVYQCNASLITQSSQALQRCMHEFHADRDHARQV